MSDEVKEILHLLKRCDNTYLKIENSNGEKEYEYHKVNDLRLDGYHSQLLLDYITNLQKENETLKELNVCVGYYYIGALRFAYDEIERLNNIINELEQEMNEELKIESSGEDFVDGYDTCLKDFLQRLKELKQEN